MISVSLHMMIFTCNLFLFTYPFSTTLKKKSDVSIYIAVAFNQSGYAAFSRLALDCLYGLRRFLI